MSRSRSAPLWQVYIDNTIDPLARVLSVQESLGGKRLDHAVIEIDPRRLQQHGIAITLLPNMTSQVVISEHFDNQNFIRHWGKIAEIEPHIDPSGMRWRITSRMEPYHFSLPLTGAPMRDPVTKKLIATHRLVVFNPTIDGKPEPNCSPAEPTVNEANYFLDPESVRTPSSLKLHGDKEPKHWTLAKAVYTLCKMLNPGPWVDNPDYAEIKDIFSTGNVIRDESLLRNVTMPFGAYLAQCLDRLLFPLGYLWYVDKNHGGLGNKLKFLKKGSGGRKLAVKHQKPGSSYDNKSSEAFNVTLRYGLSNLANRVWAFGSAERVEFTAECVKTWSASHDTKTMEELRASGENFEEVENVYRKWVIDTAGDYVDARPENATLRFDLEKLFGNGKEIPGRRKLGPTLTLGADGAPIGQIQGVYVEYSNPNYDSADPNSSEWLPIGNWGCALLEKEGGIYFRGEFVPEEILSQGANAKIRLTATLESNQRVEFDTKKAPTSPNGENVWLALDLADRYFYTRQIVAADYKSRFAEDVAAGVRESNVNYETLVLKTFAEELQDTYDAAEIAGPLELDGCDFDFRLGDRITEIQGLGINLGANLSGKEEQFPQISSISYEPQTNKMTLQLERYKSDVTPPEATRMQRKRRR